MGNRLLPRLLPRILVINALRPLFGVSEHFLKMEWSPLSSTFCDFARHRQGPNPYWGYCWGRLRVGRAWFERGVALGSVAGDQPRDPRLGDVVVACDLRLGTAFENDSNDHHMGARFAHPSIAVRARLKSGRSPRWWVPWACQPVWPQLGKTVRVPFEVPLRTAEVRGRRGVVGGVFGELR